MNLSAFSQSMLAAIEAELKRHIALFDAPATRAFHHMLSYHMGWNSDPTVPHPGGKRIRPLLLLLTSAACGADWRPALPAAAAIELVHNFTLVHDDIQDRSAFRRGRPTVWSRWGEAMAINVGDALFAVASHAILALEVNYPPEAALKAARLLQDACMEVTRGQFLDMTAQASATMTVDDYWPLVSGKTAALLSTSTHIGAVLGNAPTEKQEAFQLFAFHLGLAFQVQDDILGIWGNEALTGKSAASDLLAGKKTLPVVFGLQAAAEFAAAWERGPILESDIPRLAEKLASEGGRAFAEAAAAEQTALALKHLERAGASGEAAHELLSLAQQLLTRMN